MEFARTAWTTSRVRWPTGLHRLLRAAGRRSGAKASRRAPWPRPDPRLPQLRPHPAPGPARLLPPLAPPPSQPPPCPALLPRPSPPHGPACPVPPQSVSLSAQPGIYPSCRGCRWWRRRTLRSQWAWCARWTASPRWWSTARSAPRRSCARRWGPAVQLRGNICNHFFTRDFLRTVTRCAQQALPGQPDCRPGGRPDLLWVAVQNGS